MELMAAGVDNNNANPTNITLTIEGTRLYVSVFTLPAKDNEELSKPVSREFEMSVYWNEYKTKSENKNTTNEYRSFLE